MDNDHSIIDDENDENDENEEQEQPQQRPGDQHGQSAGRPIGSHGSDATGGAVLGSQSAKASDEEMRGTDGGADTTGSEAPEPDKPNLPHAPE